MFKFLIDQNIPKKVSVFLRKQKYDIKLVQKINPEMIDLEVLALAEKEQRIIISNDKDFISLGVTRKNIDMILFGLIDQTAEIRIKYLQKILRQIKKIGFGVLVIK